jgi:hypothetical protein
MRNTPITDAIIAKHYDTYTPHPGNTRFIAALVDECRRFENELGDAKGWRKQHEATIKRLEAVIEAMRTESLNRLHDTIMRGRQ